MLEEQLKNIIVEKFGSVRQFAFKIDIPYTTVDSILKRGIDNSNVGNVIKMCKALEISIDNLLDNACAFAMSKAVRNTLIVTTERSTKIADFSKVNESLKNIKGIVFVKKENE